MFLKNVQVYDAIGNKLEDKVSGMLTDRLPPSKKTTEGFSLIAVEVSTRSKAVYIKYEDAFQE